MSFKNKNPFTNKVVLKGNKNSSCSSSSTKSIQDIQAKKESENQPNQNQTQTNQNLIEIIDCDENTQEKNKDTKLLTSTYNSFTKTTNLRQLSDSSSKIIPRVSKDVIDKNDMMKSKTDKTMQSIQTVNSNHSNYSNHSNPEKIFICDKCKNLKKELESLRDENKKLKIEIKKLKVQSLNELNERNRFKEVISDNISKIQTDTKLIHKQKEEIDRLLHLNNELSLKYEEVVKTYTNYNNFNHQMNKLSNSYCNNSKLNKNNMVVSNRRVEGENENEDFSNSNININDYEPITLNDNFDNNEIKLNLGGHIFLDFAERSPLDINNNISKEQLGQEYYNNIKTTITKDLSVFNDEYSVDDFLRNKLDL